MYNKIYLYRNTILTRSLTLFSLVPPFHHDMLGFGRAPAAAQVSSALLPATSGLAPPRRRTHSGRTGIKIEI